LGSLFIDNSHPQLSLCSWRWSLLSWRAGLTRAWRKTRFSRISSFHPTSSTLHNPTPAALLHRKFSCIRRPASKQLPLGRPPTPTPPTQTPSNIALSGPSFVQRAIRKSSTKGPPSSRFPRVKGAADVLRREKVLRTLPDRRHRTAPGTYEVGSPRAWQHQASVPSSSRPFPG